MKNKKAIITGSILSFLSLLLWFMCFLIDGYPQYFNAIIFLIITIFYSISLIPIGSLNDLLFLGVDGPIFNNHFFGDTAGLFFAPTPPAPTFLGLILNMLLWFLIGYIYLLALSN